MWKINFYISNYSVWLVSMQRLLTWNAISLLYPRNFFLYSPLYGWGGCSYWDKTGSIWLTWWVYFLSQKIPTLRSQIDSLIHKWVNLTPHYRYFLEQELDSSSESNWPSLLSKVRVWVPKCRQPAAPSLMMRIKCDQNLICSDESNWWKSNFLDSRLDKTLSRLWMVLHPNIWVCWVLWVLCCTLTFGFVGFYGYCIRLIYIYRYVSLCGRL